MGCVFVLFLDELPAGLVFGCVDGTLLTALALRDFEPESVSFLLRDDLAVFDRPEALLERSTMWWSTCAMTEEKIPRSGG